MILQFSQMRFTELLTFMFHSTLSNDPALTPLRPTRASIVNAAARSDLG
jgi:hypothetical protein